MTKETRIPEIRKNRARAGPLASAFGIRHSGFVIIPARFSVTPTTQPWFARIVMMAMIIMVCGGCASVSPKPAATADQEIRAVLEAQVHDWNAGDLRGFMEGYAQSDRTRFQSGGELSMGWQTVFERYQKRYGNRTSMGTLSFRELEVTVLGPDAAMVTGRWRLKRGQDSPSGLFTLVFRRTPDGWRIVHDHTSAAAP